VASIRRPRPKLAADIEATTLRRRPRRADWLQATAEAAVFGGPYQFDRTSLLQETAAGRAWLFGRAMERDGMRRPSGGELRGGGLWRSEEP
jgi:hypothetical protein